MDTAGQGLQGLVRFPVTRTALACSLFVTIAVGTGGCASAPPVPTVSPAPLTFDDGSEPTFGLDMVGCLSELGWPVSTGTDGSYKTGTIPEDQVESYQTDVDGCLKQFGCDQSPPSLSDQQLRELYPHVLWEWKCLNEAGYNPSSPPSEQAYIDSYHDNGGTWSAYSQFTATLPEKDITELFEACPRST